ncbi:transcriptional regulator, partial [Flavonifractor plautii]|nr:transcriptional regulator [Flavonifractor plautii]
MEDQELLWSASGQELMRGVALLDGQYRCLLCGAAFPQGEVFPRGGRFYDAEAMAALHLREAHGSMLEYLLHRNPGLLGLSEVQLELLR